MGVFKLTFSCGLDQNQAKCECDQTAKKPHDILADDRNKICSRFIVWRKQIVNIVLSLEVNSVCRCLLPRRNTLFKFINLLVEGRNRLIHKYIHVYLDNV